MMVVVVEEEEGDSCGGVAIVSTRTDDLISARPSSQAANGAADPFIRLIQERPSR